MKTKSLKSVASSHLPAGIDEQYIVYCGEQEIGRVTKYEFINLIDARMSICEKHQKQNTFDDGFEYIAKEFQIFLNEIAE